MKKSRPLKYPFNKLTEDGKSILVPAKNYRKRNTVQAAARSYAKRNQFRVTVSVGDSLIQITRIPIVGEVRA